MSVALPAGGGRSRRGHRRQVRGDFGRCSDFSVTCVGRYLFRTKFAMGMRSCFTRLKTVSGKSRRRPGLFTYVSGTCASMDSLFARRCPRGGGLTRSGSGIRGVGGLLSTVGGLRRFMGPLLNGKSRTGGSRHFCKRFSIL